METLLEKFGFNKDSFKKVFSNFSWLMFEQILRIVVGFIISVFFIRKFSVETYGAFNYSLAFITFFTAIAGLGLDQIVIRDLVAKPEDRDKIIGTSLVMKLVASLMSIVLALMIVSFLRPGNGLIFNLVLAFSFSFIFQSFYVFDFWFQSKVLSRYSVVARSIGFLVANGLKIILLIKSAPIIYFAYIFSFESLLSLLGLWFFYKYKNNDTKMLFNLILGKQMLKSSWPLILSGLAIYFYMRLNQILLGNILGDKEVGIYSLAVMFSEFWYFVPISMCNSVFPSLIKYKNTDNSLYKLRTKQFFRFLFFLSVGVAILVTIFGKYFIVLVYGLKYVESSQVLSILIWSGVAVSMGVASGQLLIIDKLTKISLLRTLLGALTNVLLGIILIPKWGVYGAAWSALFGYLVSVYSGLVFKKGRESNMVLLNFWKNNE